VLERHLLPPEQEVTFWLPKLEGREEIIAHRKCLDIDGRVYQDSSFPPPGMTSADFGRGVIFKEDNQK